jgi:hypothetical protein
VAIVSSFYFKVRYTDSATFVGWVVRVSVAEQWNETQHHPPEYYN